MQWIIDNKEWLFSGVGVLIISTLIGFFIRKMRMIKQTQKSGTNSTNYQSAGDMTIKTKND